MWLCNGSDAISKGLVPEQHPHFIGTYWGAVGTAFCGEIVESANAYILMGLIFNDYSSVGFSLLLKREKAIIGQPDHVIVAHSPFGCVLMKYFLRELAKKIKKNTTAYENYSALEGAESTILLASGMCAITVLLMALVPAGGHSVITTDFYRKTRIFIEVMLLKMRTSATSIDLADIGGLKSALEKKNSLRPIHFLDVLILNWFQSFVT